MVQDSKCFSLNKTGLAIMDSNCIANTFRQIPSLVCGMTKKCQVTLSMISLINAKSQILMNDLSVSLFGFVCVEGEGTLNMECLWDEGCLHQMHIIFNRPPHTVK